MKIKRFRARTIREALRQVREEQGPESVILSKHKTADGIEVIAAVDYDEALLHQSLHQSANQIPGGRVPSPAPAPNPAEASDAVSAFEMAAREARLAAEETPVNASRDSVTASDSTIPGEPTIPMNSSNSTSPGEPARPFKLFPPSPALETEYEIPIVVPESTGHDRQRLREIHQELQTVREAMEKQYSELRWDELQRREPRFAEVIRRLTLMDLSRSLTESIVRDLNGQGDQQQVWRNAIGLLARRLPLATADLAEEGGILALVGPTGAGKTTCVAKLAARFAMSHGTDQIGLVTTDGDRIGAQEQLFRFGKILGVPVQVATDGQALAAALSQLAGKRLVLVDTAGFGPRNEESFARLQAILNPSPTIQTLLTLPANVQTGSLEEAIQAFDPLGLDGVVATKLDEATSLGGLLSVLIERELMVCYVADGQDIPEDLRPGARYRADFVSQAVKLACTSSRERDPGMSRVAEVAQSRARENTSRLKERLRVSASG